MNPVKAEIMSRLFPFYFRDYWIFMPVFFFSPRTDSCCQSTMGLNSISSHNNIKPISIATKMYAKGQLISKANCEAMNASKKRTNEFVFSCVFVRFLEEIEDTKKVFRN